MRQVEEQNMENRVGTQRKQPRSPMQGAAAAATRRGHAMQTADGALILEYGCMVSMFAVVLFLWLH
jgi:hypothetical protein